MANAAAISVSFLKEVLSGTHNIGNGGNSMKGALYLSSGSLSHTTTAYSTTSELTNTGYTAGGAAITVDANSISSTSKTAYWTPSTSVSWATLTASGIDALHIYNTTQSSKSVMVVTFTAQTVTAADFTLTMPTNDSATALMRIAVP